MIIIVPSEYLVLIEGRRAYPVNMSTVDPEIHAIQFDPQLGKGHIEYVPNSEGVIPALEDIISLDQWGAQIAQAEAIFFCEDNPKTYYKTVEPVGQPVYVYSEGWPQPGNTSETPPPTKPSENTVLYWNGSEFVWSCFPITLGLEDAKAFMVQIVQKTAYDILLPTDWMVVRKVETSIEIPAEVTSWRTDVRVSANVKKSNIEGSESLEALELYCESPDFSTWPPTP